MPLKPSLTNRRMKSERLQASTNSRVGSVSRPIPSITGNGWPSFSAG
jgi:hypothetical protein